MTDGTDHDETSIYEKVRNDEIIIIGDKKSAAEKTAERVRVAMAPFRPSIADSESEEGDQ